MNEFIHVAEIALPLLLQGLGTTAAISVLSILIAIVLGSAVGYMCLSKNKAVELIARAFIKIFRCTPFMVQVYLAYYGLPALGLNVSAFSTGVIILGMYTAAYTAVILESGVSAIPKGLSRFKTMVRIIFPQTLKIIVPSLTGQFVQTVKDSSILSIITVAEMTMMTKEAIGITFSPLIVYICAGVLYWALNLVIEFASRCIEKHNNRVAI
jgi:His/Glu/Gln/Arg/opine family amino acid ABC transporter permease subunit